jgi:hypothetical protein
MTIRRVVVAFVVFTALTGAGATAGLQLTGDVGGVAETRVDTSLVVVADEFSSADVTFSDGAAPPVVVDTARDSDRFSVNFNADQSAKVTVSLPVENRADAVLAGRLNLTITDGPTGVDTNQLTVSAVATGDDEFNDGCRIDAVTTESNSSKNTTSIEFEAPSVTKGTDTCADRIAIEIELDGPGFYRVEGTLRTISV